MPIDIARTDDGDLTTLSIKGQLDVATAPEAHATVDAIVQDQRKHVTVDLAGLDMIDSSGVAVIVGLYKRVRAEGGEVEVVGVRDQPEAIFKLLRLDKVFQVSSHA
ncbi:STAS domain-containing protein [Nannocystaceae bacterium ST9]